MTIQEMESTMTTTTVDLEIRQEVNKLKDTIYIELNNYLTEYSLLFYMHLLINRSLPFSAMSEALHTFSKTTISILADITYYHISKSYIYEELDYNIFCKTYERKLNIIENRLYNKMVEGSEKRTNYHDGLSRPLYIFQTDPEKMVIILSEVFEVCPFENILFDTIQMSVEKESKLCLKNI